MSRRSAIIAAFVAVSVFPGIRTALGLTLFAVLLALCVTIAKNGDAHA
ncbi:hypothetical protein [Actinomadura madurae]|nr:hypothetical protein [Actinomadura madurae]MCP9947321.1 hypothetical protein [Actinomadura madurae]MCP9964086.1 hypothetical protein [Actinomadura madurae]MCP9976558.1 hypothetical protein [Actinomadura madurae]MCQ0011944.1 hypothetical protein [Actinomadura madurae]MCQ0012754.1 hypothetical protein [Actinomadura madurae]